MGKKEPVKELVKTPTEPEAPVFTEIIVKRLPDQVIVEYLKDYNALIAKYVSTTAQFYKIDEKGSARSIRICLRRVVEPKFLQKKHKNGRPEQR